MTAGHERTLQETDTSSENQNVEIDLAKVFRTLWRGKFIIALFGAIFLALGTAHAFLNTVPMYTASTTIAFESRQDQTVDIESVMTGLGGDQATVNTEVEVIRSRGLAAKVVEDLDLINDPEFNEDLVPPSWFSLRAITKGIFQFVTRRPEPPEGPRLRAVRDAVVDKTLAAFSISNVRQSFVFRITATTTDPTKSAAMANALAKAYIADQLNSKFKATEQATEWLTSRVAQLKTELENAELAVKSFNADADLVSPQALVALNRQIKELRSRAQEAKDTEAQANVSGLQDAVESGDMAVIAALANDPALTRLAEQFNKAPSFATRRLFDARAKLLIQRKQVEQERAQNQTSALQATIALQEEKIERQSSDLVVLQQLQREAEASRLIYEFFLGRLKETSVQQGIQRADSRILSEAVVPGSPSAPRKSLIMLMSLILGLMGGAGLVLLRELSQNTYRESEALEKRTGYTVIGQIPLIPARRRKNVLKYLTDKPTSAAAEAVRNLRTSILLSNIDKPPQIIMSTSSIPGEGKTTQSLALAQNLTGLDKKVLLIEGDIRRRVFAEYFEIENKKGLLAVLSGDATLKEAVVFEPSLKADMLIGEKAKTNAADIFSSTRFGEFLEELRGQYDYIIIDTPPVLIVPDARVIAQSVDAVMYTVRWDHTTQRQVSDGLKAFENVGVRVSGLVLSQVNPKGMKKYGLGDTYGAYGGGYYDN